MIVPDVNLLILAELDLAPQHVPAAVWWRSVITGSEPVGLTLPVVFGFVRLATSGRLIRPPMSVADAHARVGDWLGRPHVRMLEAGAGHVELVLDLLRRVGTGGNLTTDAQIAALALEHNGTVYSHDADFARFEGLRWIDPLVAKRRP